MRNIDKLRSMKTKEIAEFVVDHTAEMLCKACIYDKTCKEEKFYEGKCVKGVRKWLKQEYKEND